MSGFRRGYGKRRDAGVPEYASYGTQPGTKDFVRATTLAGKAVHWAGYRDKGQYIPTTNTLCGKPVAGTVNGLRPMNFRLKDYRDADVCLRCEDALKNIRTAEAAAYAKNYDEDGEPKKQPTPKERATAVKAKATARPKKPWQPKNKQRSFRVDKTLKKRHPKKAAGAVGLD